MKGNSPFGQFLQQGTINLAVKKRSKYKQENPALRKLLIQSTQGAHEEKKIILSCKILQIKRVIYKILEAEKYKERGY